MNSFGFSFFALVAVRPQYVMGGGAFDALASGIIVCQLALAVIVFRENGSGERFAFAFLTLVPFVGAVVPAVHFLVRASPGDHVGRRIFGLVCAAGVAFLAWVVVLELEALHFGLAYSGKLPRLSMPSAGAYALTLLVFACAWRVSEPVKLMRILTGTLAVGVMAFVVYWGALLETGLAEIRLHNAPSRISRGVR